MMNIKWIFDMKIKHLLLPYAFVIVVLPAILAHLAGSWRMNVSLWETVIDILMVVTAGVGLVMVGIREKSKFRGWIPLLALLLLVLAPQMFLWKSQNRGFYELRTIYRFALLYITLFVIPLGVRFTHREICLLIGCFCVFGLVCCAYELWAHPRILDEMISTQGYGIMSWFGQRNRFAAYLALWLILCVLAMLLSENKLWLIPGGVFALFLVFTESRGGLVLTGMFCIGMLISYRERLGTKNILMIFADLALVFFGLLFFGPTRDFFISFIGLDRGVTFRDRIWKVAWSFFLESNPIFGHGLGTEIERIMIERIGRDYGTHNMYLYILVSGGILLMAFYIFSVITLLRQTRHHKFRKHYVIPMLIAFLVYGFFEMAAVPFDYWHLSNMFTICLFMIPSTLE